MIADQKFVSVSNQLEQPKIEYVIQKNSTQKKVALKLKKNKNGVV